MLTLTHTKTTSPLSDLAAGLTDLTLELLTRSGVHGDSVEMELETWLALTEEIEHEFDLLQRRASLGGEFYLHGVIENAVHRAALRVASVVGPEHHDPSEIEGRIRPGVASLRVPHEKRAALARLSPQPQESRRPVSGSGVVRRFQVTALN